MRCIRSDTRTSLAHSAIPVGSQAVLSLAPSIAWNNPGGRWDNSASWQARVSGAGDGLSVCGGALALAKSFVRARRNRISDVKPAKRPRGPLPDHLTILFLTDTQLVWRTAQHNSQADALASGAGAGPSSAEKGSPEKTTGAPPPGGGGRSLYCSFFLK